MTPALSSKPKREKVNLCVICSKTFFDKATLNRHKKNLHKQNKIVNKHSKSVNFVDDVKIKEIPVTKAIIRPDLHNDIINIFDHCESVMMIFTNRQQCVTFNELTNFVERKTNRVFDIFAFRTLMSIYPESYTLYFQQNSLAIKVNAFKINPSLITKRKIILCEYLHESQKEVYIDLIDLPKPKVIQNYSAQKIIKDNIIKLEFIEENMCNNINVKDIKVFTN